MTPRFQPRINDYRPILYHFTWGERAQNRSRSAPKSQPAKISSQTERALSHHPIWDENLQNLPAIDGVWDFYDCPYLSNHLI